MSADPGTADQVLLAALARWDERPSAATSAGVHAALLGARVLVPVVAELLAETAAETAAEPAAEPAAAPAAAPAGQVAEKATDLSLVTLVGADGRIALPVFTSVAAMVAWRSDVRPVAVAGPVACAAAVAEGHAAVVVDLAGASFVLADSALAALAAGSLPAAAPPRRRRWLRPLVLAQLAVVEAVVWGVAWAVFRGPEAFYPAMFVGGLLGAAVVARAVG